MADVLGSGAGGERQGDAAAAMRVWRRRCHDICLPAGIAFWGLVGNLDAPPIAGGFRFMPDRWCLCHVRHRDGGAFCQAEQGEQTTCGEQCSPDPNPIDQRVDDRLDGDEVFVPSGKGDVEVFAEAEADGDFAGGLAGVGAAPES